MLFTLLLLCLSTSTCAFPAPVNVLAPCNASSTCNYGVCRDHVCLCDNGYSTIDAAHPCESQGVSQLMLILLAWTFGGLGVPAFMLGWWKFATATLLLMLCTVWSCAYSNDADDDFNYQQVDKELQSATKKARKAYIKCCSVFTAVAWIALTLTVNIAVGTKQFCVSSNGVQCKLI